MSLRVVITPVPDCQSLTPPQRVARQRDYARRALGHAAVLAGLEAPCEWPQDANRVPIPVNGQHWSISHKPGCAGAVIAGQPVGIDIESLAPRRHRGLFEKLAGDEEWVLLGHEWDHFFRMWTAKEATLKANGRGIGGFSECVLTAVLDETHLHMHYATKLWPITHQRILGHIVAVTVVEEPVEWIVEQL